MEVITSVRNLVEFILRSGDIDNRRASAPESAMQEGGRIHRMLQRRMGADYHAEVTLKYTYHTPKYDIIVEGRADGIIDGQLAKRILKEVPVQFREPDQPLIEAAILQKDYPDTIGDTVVIDEIKGTYADVSRMKAPVSVHLAQAKCYAYIYAKQNDLPYIRVRMTYCNMETEELQYFFQDYRFQDLEKWFEGLMQSYQKWADYEVDWKEKLALNMENMVKEQISQGQRLTELEGRDGEMWRKVVGWVISAVVGVAVGYFFFKLGVHT